MATSIAFSFVRTCEGPTSHDFELQSRATEFLGLHRITCRLVPCIGTYVWASVPTESPFFTKLQKPSTRNHLGWRKDIVLQDKGRDHWPPKPSFYHGPEDSDLRHLLAPRYGTHHLNICPFLFLVHSRGSQSIIQRKVTQAPIQRLSKLGKCDSCLNYLLASMSELSLSSPWDPIYHVHMNMVGFIMTASAHHYLSTGFTFFSSRRGGPSPSLEGVCLEVLA